MIQGEGGGTPSHKNPENCGCFAHSRIGHPGSKHERPQPIRSCGKRHTYCAVCRPDVIPNIGTAKHRQGCQCPPCGGGNHHPQGCDCVFCVGHSNQNPSALVFDLAAFLLGAGYDLIPEVYFGHYHVDLYEPFHHIAFEADGAYWHGLPGRREADEKRDAHLLSKHGLPVIRFTEEEIRGFAA